MFNRILYTALILNTTLSSRSPTVSIEHISLAGLGSFNSYVICCHHIWRPLSQLHFSYLLPQHICEVYSWYLVYMNKDNGDYLSVIEKLHDDVMKWKYFPRYWPFVWAIHRSLVNSPQKGQWRGALMFSLICAWINGWVNNREAGYLRRHRVHRYVITSSSGFMWYI